jgi:hypothetical protein
MNGMLMLAGVAVSFTRSAAISSSEHSVHHKGEVHVHGATFTRQLLLRSEQYADFGRDGRSYLATKPISTERYVSGTICRLAVIVSI